MVILRRRGVGGLVYDRSCGSCRRLRRRGDINGEIKDGVTTGSGGRGGNDGRGVGRRGRGRGRGRGSREGGPMKASFSAGGPAGK